MDDLRTAIETVVEGPVSVTDTGYGFSCHVAHPDASAGTSFAAVDVDRRVPQVYFDAGAARGRSAVANARRRDSVAYVIERLLTDHDRVVELLERHPDRYGDRLQTDGGVRLSPEVGPPSIERPDPDWLHEAITERCQYLHGRPVRERGGRHADFLEAFEREPLTNDRLGQQFGWRVAVAERLPDLPLELLVMESHAQVAAVHTG